MHSMTYALMHLVYADQSLQCFHKQTQPACERYDVQHSKMHIVSMTIYSDYQSADKNEINKPKFTSQKFTMFGKNNCTNIEYSRKNNNGQLYKPTQINNRKHEKTFITLTMKKSIVTT